MVETLLFFGIGSLAVVCAATLVVSTLALRTARRYVDLAEERLEDLREGQDRLLALLREERHIPRKEPEQESEEQDLERVARTKRELLGLRTSPRRQEAGPEIPPSPSDGLVEDTPAPRHLPWDVELPNTGTREGAGGTGPSGTKARKPGENKPEDKSQRRAVWRPHPDDDIALGRAAERTRSQSDSPVEMFRRHYDKYLENYEGYVKLAERIHRMRRESGVAPDSPAGREWEERLRRANDGIDRTIARLDILEEYNPELATDDRISRRASIAHSHWKLDRDKPEHRDS